MNYKDTINLPKTAFSMRANLTNKEPDFLKNWADRKIYEKILDKNKDNEQFILHDGPPYANGNIHIGHALNKILKDFVIKYKTLRGFNAPYVPGWDCHGMPIEHKVVENLGEQVNNLSQAEIRKKCKEYALKYVDIQKKDFQRLGIFGEWDNPYLTLNKVYEAAIIEMFGDLVEKDYIYKKLKPVHWCGKCHTALAEAEVEYAEHTSPSIYVKFNVKSNFETPGLPEDTKFLIWTTTPWTIPANVAIAVHPDFRYVLFETSHGKLIAVSQLVDKILEKLGEPKNIIKEILGSELEGVVCSHPYLDRESKVVLGDYVTVEDGTGCVHIAPGHGQEDYELGLKYDLPIISPVNDEGRFTEEFEFCQGKHVFEANKILLDMMKEKNILLIDYEEISHSYPHCWRCKSPIIFRATSQWFLKVDHKELRNRVLEIIKNKVTWLPDWGEDRIRAMVENRPDWCLSRQRTWGVPIPAFTCNNCNQVILEKSNIDYFMEIVKKEGVDSWFIKDIKDLLPENYKCPKCGSQDLSKETDILDVWFDSGSSHIGVLEKRDNLNSPADLYLEGSDQHRGWFQLSMLPSVAVRDRAPFKTVLTHGFVVDSNGIKMSKSIGNVMAPQDIINSYGADILRLWVASEDYKDDVRIGDDIIKRLIDTYKKLRNTSRFLLGNLNDFDYKTDTVEFEDMLSVDKYMMLKTHKLLEEITQYYDNYKFHKVYRRIYNFCTLDLSSFYLDLLKDRLYIAYTNSKERRSAQTVLFEVIRILTHILSPILVFTSYEIAEEYKDLLKGEADNIFLSDWPEIKKEYFNDELENEWDTILKIREDVLKGLEIARAGKKIGQSLDAEIVVYLNDENYNIADKYKDDIFEIMIVSRMELRKISDMQDESQADYAGEFGKVVVKISENEKCGRCWKKLSNVGENDQHPSLCKKCADIIVNHY